MWRLESQIPTGSEILHNTFFQNLGTLFVLGNKKGEGRRVGIRERDRGGKRERERERI